MSICTLPTYMYMYVYLAPSLSLPSSQSGNVGEFMSAVLGIHSHYHQLVTDIFSSHKQFHSALDRVSISNT